MKDSKEKTVVVSLISDQTIPNVQFLKWYFDISQDDADLLFMSTVDMEKKGKSECVRSAMSRYLSSENLSDVLLVDSDDIELISKNLEDYFASHNYGKIVVNITGGTKMMSMVSYNFFSNMENAEIYYLPLGKSIQMIYPEKATMAENIELDLDEYMKAFGIKYSTDNRCVKSWDYNQNVLDLVLKYRDDIKVLVGIQDSNYIKRHLKKKVDFTLIDEKYLQNHNFTLSREKCCALLKDFGFDPSSVGQNELRYITGGWFEEYIYQQFLNNNNGNIRLGNIALNVSIERGNDKNELDVVYLDKQNKFHVFECKSFLEGFGGDKVLNEALYKLQAIIKSKFGLNIKPGLCTMSVVDKESALNKASEFGIKVIDGNMIRSKNIMEKIIK